MDNFDPLSSPISRRRTFGLAAAGALGVFTQAEVAGARVQAAEDFDYFAPRILRSPFSERNVDSLVGALALAGIPVYEHATDLLPMKLMEGQRSPLKLLLSQVRNMALELSAGGGIRGLELDAAVRSPEGVPPISFLLAGYIVTAQTTRGELARALLGEREWEYAPEQVYPALVIDLFVSDLAMDSGSSTAELSIVRLSQPAGVCSAVQEFIDDVLASVFDALKIDQPKGSSNLLTDIWNWIVGAGESVVEGLANTLTAPVIAAIQAITGVIAIGTSINSMLMVWTVNVDAQPPNTRFGVDDEFITGKVVASIDAGGQEDWPEELASCASTAGITLPSLQGEGSAVSWKISQIPGNLIVEMGKSPLVENSGIAEYIYHTSNEPADVAEGIPIEGLVIVELTVERSDVAQLRDNMLAILSTNLPAPFGAAVEAVLGPAIVSLTSDLAQVLVKGYGFESVKVIYHEKQITVTPEPESPEEPGETENACPIGVWYMSGFGVFFESLMAASGAAAAMTYVGESGELVLEVRPDGTFTSASLDFEAGFTDGIYNYIATLKGTESGTYTIEGDTISGVLGSGSLSLTMVVEGILEQDIPFGTVGGGSAGFVCDGQDLLLYSTDIPIRWSPYDPD